MKTPPGLKILGDIITSSEAWGFWLTWFFSFLPLKQKTMKLSLLVGEGRYWRWWGNLQGSIPWIKYWSFNFVSPFCWIFNFVCQISDFLEISEISDRFLMCATKFFEILISPLWILVGEIGVGVFCFGGIFGRDRVLLLQVAALPSGLGWLLPWIYFASCLVEVFWRQHEVSVMAEWELRVNISTSEVSNFPFPLLLCVRGSGDLKDVSPSL